MSSKRLSKKLILTMLFSALPFSKLMAETTQNPNLKNYGHIPDEYESDGGHMLGFGLGGVAAVPDQGSVRANPAMLVFDKLYQVSAGYHWPSMGREYYQAGIVDAKTSEVAAGVTYTAALDDIKPDQTLVTDDEKLNQYYDSPIKNRISFGLAQAFSTFSAGVGLQLVKVEKKLNEEIKGNTLGLGVAGLLTPSLRFSVSAENLGNKKIQDYAPTSYRGGLAYTFFNGDVSAHLDYKQRERVSQEKLSYVAWQAGQEELGSSTHEKMAIASCSARVQDLLRLIGAYGHEVGGADRRLIAGGVALVNKGFVFSYLLNRPYLSEKYVHQAINLSFQLAI